jgi:hypothetical protein
MPKHQSPLRVKPRNHHAAALYTPALRPKVIESKKTVYNRAKDRSRDHA